jgi:hypothetical protein
LVRKLGGNKPLGRYRHEWEGSIEMYLKQSRAASEDWINSYLGRDRWRVLVNTVINFDF